MKKFIFILFWSGLFAIVPPPTSDTPYALIFFPCNFSNDPYFVDFANSVREIFTAHGYQIVDFSQTVDQELGAPRIYNALPKLIEYLTIPLIPGFITIYTHGRYDQSGSWIAVEYFPPEEGEKCEREG